MIKPQFLALLLLSSILTAGCGLFGPRILWRTQLQGTVSAPPHAGSAVLYLPTSFLLYAVQADGGKIKWQQDLPGGSHFPVWADDAHVYVFSDLGNLYAVDREHGIVNWQYAGQAHPVATLVPYANLLLGLTQNHVFAVERDRGRLHWRRAVRNPVPGSLALLGSQASIATADGRWLLIDIASGKLTRSIQATGHLAVAPLVTPSFTLLATTRGWLQAVSLLTGKTFWSYKIFNPIVISPLYLGSTIYLGSGSRIYTMLIGGNVLWSFGCDGDVRPPLLLRSNILYVFTDRGNLYALDAHTGKPYWSVKQMDPRPRYMLSLDSSLVALPQGLTPSPIQAFDPISGSRLWRMALEELVVAEPVVQNGVVYIAGRTGGLYAVQP